MKPFNLEAALKGESVVTRSGVKIEAIFFDPLAGPGYKVYARCEDEDKGFCYPVCGTFTPTHVGHPRDLFMAPKKRTVWLNLYSISEKMRGHAAWHPTEDEADRNASNKRFGGRAFPLEIEE